MALADSITDIFLIGVGVVAVGLAIGLFMPRVRMRGRDELLAEAQGADASGDAAGAGEDAPEFAGDPERAGAPGR